MTTSTRATSADADPTRSGGSPLDGSVDPWKWWRAQMPIAPRFAYFDHAAVGPLSGPGADAISDWAGQAAQLGDTVWPRWNATVERLHEQTAELINCRADEVALVPNTTTGINWVAEGFPWVAGDNVVLPAGEFPSNLFPWLNQRSRGVEVRIVPRRGHRVEINDLIDHCDERTRMIAASWVGYASGFRIDIEGLVAAAHRRGVLVFLDAIQGLGVFPLDLRTTPVDFLAADGHKWLLGPEGLGVAVIRRTHLHQIRCGNVGWGSVKNSFNYSNPSFDLRNDARRFESGSANMVAAAALSASLEIPLAVIRHFGRRAIPRRVLAIAASLDRRLRDLGIETRLPAEEDRRSGIVTFEVPGVEPNSLRESAAGRNVIVSCRDGAVRAAVHAYNDESDLDRLVECVRDCRAQADTGHP